MSERAFETKLNVLLGLKLSKELGLRAVSETMKARRRPDIVLYVNGVKVVLEGSYSKTDAENDVRSRIKNGIGDLGVAVFYKDRLSANFSDNELDRALDDAKLEVRLIAPVDLRGTLLEFTGEGPTGTTWVTSWIDAKVLDLVSILRDSVQFLLEETDVERALQEAESVVNDFVAGAESVDSTKTVAKALYEVFYKLNGLSVGDFKQIDDLIYAQAALALLLSSAFYQSVHAQLKLGDLEAHTQQNGVRLGLKQCFVEIKTKDYKPIYDVALEVIDAIPDSMATSLKKIGRLAIQISSQRTLISRDFAGKIYHKIVGDWSVRKNFATFYTTIPAAYLLAYLAVFDSPESLRQPVKVCDLTRGSGTLLMAAYDAIRDHYVSQRFQNDEAIDLEQFHREMLELEERVWGFDALRYAVQIASLNLVFQNPTTPISKTKMFAVPLGVEDGAVSLGSLEFLKGVGLPSISAYFAAEPTPQFLKGAKVASAVDQEEIPEKIPKFDLIVMNPPFTRATGRGGREGGGLFGFLVDESVREAVMKEYEKQRDAVRKHLEWFALQYMPDKEDSGLRRELYSIGQAGEGLLFLYLASTILTDDGKLAFVLPKGFLTGTSWFPVRALLYKNFDIQHVIVSYDADKGYNLSQSTDLSEVLLVARRRNGSNKSPRTKITLLLKKPQTSLEARGLALKIPSAEDGDYIEVGESKAFVYTATRELLKNTMPNWGALLAFPDPELTRSVNTLIGGRLFSHKFPIASLGRIADVEGLAVRRGTFHDTFKKVAKGTPRSYPAIIGGDEKYRLRMRIEPDSHVIISKSSGREKGFFAEVASKFQVPDRLWVDTMHVSAIMSTEPVVANMFFSIKPKSKSLNNESRMKALLLWFNTTWGFLSILANRTETRGRWIELTKTKWRLLPVLDVTKLSKIQVNRLAKAFDDYCDKDLRRLPLQFDPKSPDPNRVLLDRAFLEGIGISVDESKLTDLYKAVHDSLTSWVGG